jgi:hypothetical protein
MGLTRRDALAVGAALFGGSTAGCLSGERSSVRYPDTETPDAAVKTPPSDVALVRANGSDDRETAAADDGKAPTFTPNPDLARETGRVFEELHWFATRHEAAVDAYLKAIRTAARRVDGVRREDGFDADASSRLDGITGDALETARDALGDHFAVDELVAENVTYHRGVVEKFRRRGDYDRVDEELARLSAFFRSVGSDVYAERYLSAHPVQNRLFRWLQLTEERPMLFELFYSVGSFAAYAYAGEQRRFVRDPVPKAKRREYDTLFDPAGAPDRRTDYAYVVARPLPFEKSTPPPPPMPPADPSTLPAVPVFLQRFRDAATASETRRALFDGPLTQEGTYPLGPREWRRVYYRVDGDVVYAYLLQAGAHLLATAPSEIAWEERVDWRRPLRRSWLTRGRSADGESTAEDAPADVGRAAGAKSSPGLDVGANRGVDPHANAGQGGG